MRIENKDKANYRHSTTERPQKRKKKTGYALCVCVRAYFIYIVFEFEYTKYECSGNIFRVLGKRASEPFLM